MKKSCYICNCRGSIEKMASSSTVYCNEFGFTICSGEIESINYVCDSFIENKKIDLIKIVYGKFFLKNPFSDIEKNRDIILHNERIDKLIKCSPCIVVNNET